MEPRKDLSSMNLETFLALVVIGGVILVPWVILYLTYRFGTSGRKYREDRAWHDPNFAPWVTWYRAEVLGRWHWPPWLAWIADHPVICSVLTFSAFMLWALIQSGAM